MNDLSILAVTHSVMKTLRDKFPKHIVTSATSAGGAVIFYMQERDGNRHTSLAYSVEYLTNPTNNVEARIAKDFSVALRG